MEVPALWPVVWNVRHQDEGAQGEVHHAEALWPSRAEDKHTQKGRRKQIGQSWKCKFQIHFLRVFKPNWWALLQEEWQTVWF